MILITGATGFIGRHTVLRLMADGRRVRCLLPNHRLRKLPWEDLPEVIPGSLNDSEGLYRAMTGVHTVIHLENAQWWGRQNDLERVEILGTRNLIEAARAARVGRMITLSHLGATPSSAYPLMRAKGQLEELVRGSGLAYTILRTGLAFGEDDAFFNHIVMMLRANPFFFLMPGQGEVVLHPIHIADLIHVIAQTLENLDTVDKTIEIGGPEYITLADLIRTMMRVSGQYRAVVPVPPYMLRSIISLSRWVLPRSLMTAQWLDLLATNRTAQLGTLYRYYGFQPRRLEDTLLTYVPDRVQAFADVRYRFRRRPRA